MNTKTLSAAILLATFTSVAAFGDVNGNEPAGTMPAESNNGWTSSISVEGFYGSAQEKLYKELDMDELDIGGLSVRYTSRKQTGEIISPEVFGIVSLGGGSLDQTWSSGYYRDELNYELFTMQAAVGANIRVQATDNFSLFAGARIGLALESLDMEATSMNYSSSYWHYDGNEVSLGFLYGVGIGAQLDITEHHGITVGLDYVASTAEPEFDVDGATVKIEAQSYIMLSIGYKYTF